MRRDAIAFALRSEQAPRLAAMIELAKSENTITQPYKTFDADPWIVGIPSGAVDLRDGRYVLPSSCAYLSRQLGASFNPHAKAPTWSAFLDRVMAGDVALIDFLQRAIGYTLTGHTGEQRVFILHGPGANGKSVFLRLLRLLSGDYGADAAADTFLDRKGHEASNDLARLAAIGSSAPPNSTKGSGSPNR